MTMMVIVAMIMRMMVVVMTVPGVGGDRAILIIRRSQMNIFARACLRQSIVDDGAHGRIAPPAVRPAAEAAVDGPRRPRRFLALNRGLDARIGNRIAGTDDHFLTRLNPMRQACPRDV